MMTGQSHRFFLLVVIMIGSVGLFATDIYLPALPEMALYFNCNQTEIQASFTVFLLGLALCQLMAGVLTDQFGKRRVALIGFALFTIASLGCAYSTTLSEFITFRFMQAIGGGVGSVMSRAVVVDRFDRREAVKIFSTVLPIIGLSSAAAPLIGGYLVYYLGWRSTFLFMVGFGILLFIFAAICLNNQRTISKADDMKVVVVPRMQGYANLLRNLEFLGYALIVCTGFSVFRSYTVESPFVFNKQGYGPEEMGHFYVALSIAYLSGNLMAKKLVNKQHIEKVLRVGLAFCVIGGISMVSAGFVYTESPYAVIIPMSIITFGNGFLFPISTAGAMTAVSSEYTGTASGLMGAIQFVVAACCIHWVGSICQGEVVPMSLFIGVIILAGLCSYLFLINNRAKAQVSVN